MTVIGHAHLNGLMPSLAANPLQSVRYAATLQRLSYNNSDLGASVARLQVAKRQFALQLSTVHRFSARLGSADASTIGSLKTSAAQASLAATTLAIAKENLGKGPPNQDGVSQLISAIGNTNEAVQSAAGLISQIAGAAGQLASPLASLPGPFGEPGGAVQDLAGAIQSVASATGDLANGVTDAAKTASSGQPQDVLHALEKLGGTIASVISTLADAVGQVGSAVSRIAGLVEMIPGPIGQIAAGVDSISQSVSGISSVVSRISWDAGGIADSLGDGDPQDALNALISTASDVIGSVGDIAGAVGQIVVGVSEIGAATAGGL